MRRTIGLHVLASALGLAIAGAAPVVATSFTIVNATVPDVPGGLTGTLYDPGLTGGSRAARIGRINLSGTDAGGATVSFDSWCADIFDDLQPGMFSTAPLSSAPFSTDRISAATTFLAHADALVSDATTLAAAQIGLWEILYEDENTPLDVSAGTFHVDISDAATMTANGWLASLADHDWQPEPGVSLQLLQPASGNQLQIIVDHTSAIPPIGDVPEPGTWATVLGGFGAIGAALRGQRRRDERDAHVLA